MIRKRNNMLMLCSAATISTFGSVAGAEVFTVNPGESIQTALNAASDGDVIELMPGSYFETLTFPNKIITLRGTDPDDPAVVDVTVIDADDLGTAITITGSSSSGSKIEGLTIRDGNAFQGGGLYLDDVEIELYNLDIRSNTASTDGGGIFASDSEVTASGVYLINNDNSGASSNGGGVYLIGGTHEFRYCEIEFNDVNAYGGGMYIHGADVQVVGGRIRSSTAGGGAGVFLRSGSTFTADGCVFRDNVAHDSVSNGGAAINCFTTDSSVTLRNCVLRQNSSTNEPYGAVFASGPSSFINCTFYGNTPNALATVLPGSVMLNSIVWNNGAVPMVGPLDARWSLVEHGYPGTGNISNDPLFYGPQNYRILTGSPAIDAGNSMLYSGAFTDRDGNPRGVDAPEADTGVATTGPVIDMGAFEFQVPDACPSDVDGDGVVDVNDLLAVLAAWGSCL